MSLKYTVEEAVAAWRRTARIATITSGRLNFQKDSIVVSAVTSQRDLAKEESAKFQTTYTLSKADFSPISHSHPVDISNVKLQAFGKLSNIVATVRETPDTKSLEKKTRQILEIWKNGRLHNSFDLQQFDKHGKVYVDGTFGCLEFSPDEKQLVYLAEKKEPKKQSFLQFGLTSPADGVKVGAEYEFTEDWGEQLVGKSQPVICIYNVDWEPFTNASDSSPIQVLEGSDQWSPGQMIWCSNDQLAGVAWYHHPRRMGLIYCSNRKSRFFKVCKSSGNFDWFGLENETAASPRYHDQRGDVVYLKCQAYGPHHKEQKIALVSRDGVARQIDTSKTDRQVYRGMYNQSFPDRCFSPDGKAVVFTSPCKSSIQSYVLLLDSSEVIRLTPPNGCTGSVVLDLLEDVLLVVGVSLTTPDRLFIGRLNWSNLSLPIVWQPLSSDDVSVEKPSLASDLLVFNLPDGMDYEASLIYPKNPSQKTPLIVCPHGGPHSVSTDQFIPSVYFFAQLGFAVLFVNYRGSSGFGEEALNSLLGKVGVQDVEEVHEATLTALKNHTFLDDKGVFLFGGSHGGFLVTHLSGQYPDFYRSVSTRNPVIDIATMFPITDIADWTIVEAMAEHDGGELEKLLKPETLTAMWMCSPIRYVAQVKAPTLLLVGKVDRRVPPTQSIEYYRALKLHGKKTKMLLYEDCHSLAQVANDTDCLINTVLWFKESVENV